jgi:signal transduction histidine kinase
MDDRQGVTVLILEDDAGIAALERRRLERGGYRVAVASTSGEARRAVEAGGIDLMLLDHRLSGSENGLDFYLQLRKAGLGIPSILVTGFGDQTILAQALRAGIRDFIPKTPDYLDYLTPTVDRVLQQVRTEQALERERSARAEAEAARAVLAEADRRKDEFLAMLAHELRNPLAAVAGALEVARRTDAPEDHQWAREVTARQVRHLSRLIDDLLDISRINLGKIHLRKEPADLALAIEHAAETVRPLMDAKRHDFAIELGQAPLWVEGDPTRLEQILVNLLTNAAKYTEEGGTIRLAAGLQGGQVTVAVTDTGVGIPEELRGRIFEMFAQVDQTTGRSQGGLGIGLTLVKELVRLHGGTIRVEGRADGPGSAFIIGLPARPSACVEGASGGSPAPAAPAALRILIVDDNRDAAHALARVLEADGHEVQTAGDGPSALELAPAFRPDVALLDIGLPGDLDGHEVARRLRSLAGPNRIALIAISGYGQETDRERSLAAGCAHHLVKPVDIEALLAILASEAARRAS